MSKPKKKFKETKLGIFLKDKAPTILNNVGSQVKAVLPEGVSRENKTDEELEQILLENINSQL